MMRRHLYRSWPVWCGLVWCVFFVLISLGTANEPQDGIKAKLRNPPLSGDAEPFGFEGTIAAHNVWRQAVGIPQIAWSNTLAATAQEWADFLASTKGKCRLKHRPRKGKHARPFGENLYQTFSSPDPPQPSPQEVVNAWGNESESYDAATHACASGAVCGHYTQIVWRGTQFVGCGKAACKTDQFHTVIWVCNYHPPGNVVGQPPF